MQKEFEKIYQELKTLKEEKDQYLEEDFILIRDGFLDMLKEKSSFDRLWIIPGLVTLVCFAAIIHYFVFLSGELVSHFGIFIILFTLFTSNMTFNFWRGSKKNRSFPMEKRIEFLNTLLEEKLITEKEYEKIIKNKFGV